MEGRIWLLVGSDEDFMILVTWRFLDWALDIHVDANDDYNDGNHERATK